MGSLLAKVDGKNVPLTVGYHKVTVEIRDQIARTTVEESFVNATNATLEGVLLVPAARRTRRSAASACGSATSSSRPTSSRSSARGRSTRTSSAARRTRASSSGRAATSSRRACSRSSRTREKRIRIRYTQVLPLEGDAYRYRYALHSELLRLHPLRELSIAVNVVSAAAIARGVEPDAPDRDAQDRPRGRGRVRRAGVRAERDFEVAVGVARGEPMSAIAHRRGDDGYFMLLLTPPDPAAGGLAARPRARGRAARPDPRGRHVGLDGRRGARGAGGRSSRRCWPSCPRRTGAAWSRATSSRDWLAEEPLPATGERREATARRARRAALARLDRPRRRVRRRCSARRAPATQVVYVGDGIPTAGDADPVACADRLRNRGEGPKATFHAVSTSAAYEQGVLDGDRVRRRRLGAARGRRRPRRPRRRSSRDRAARPARREALDRGHPDGGGLPRDAAQRPARPAAGGPRAVPARRAAAKTATVVLTGTVAGRPVRCTSTLAAPDGGRGQLVPAAAVGPPPPRRAARAGPRPADAGGDRRLLPRVPDHDALHVVPRARERRGPRAATASSAR